MLIVNLYGGPGAGKSTLAAAVYSQLKMEGINAELVTEFAKELTWDERELELADQLYVTATQLHRLLRLEGQVDVVVTDSPILLGAVYYRKGLPYGFDSFMAVLEDVFEHYRDRSLHYFVARRDRPYCPSGRNESETEAQRLDDEIEDWLQSCANTYSYVTADSCAASRIVARVKEKLESKCTS